MIHKKWLLLSTVLTVSLAAQAQVEHNFRMNPENTDCHELKVDLENYSVDSAANLITSKKYRFTQTVTLSRYRSPRSLAYYSCDGDLGYMLAKESETEVAIYTGVPKEIWNTLINHKDPLGYYTNQEVRKYRMKEE